MRLLTKLLLLFAQRGAPAPPAPVWDTRTFTPNEPPDGTGTLSLAFTTPTPASDLIEIEAHNGVSWGSIAGGVIPSGATNFSPVPDTSLPIRIRYTPDGGSTPSEWVSIPGMPGTGTVATAISSTEVQCIASDATPVPGDDSTITAYGYTCTGQSGQSAGNPATASFTGLTPNTAYTVTMYATDTPGRESVRRTTQVTTLLAAPQNLAYDGGTLLFTADAAAGAAATVIIVNGVNQGVLMNPAGGVSLEYVNPVSSFGAGNYSLVSVLDDGIYETPTGDVSASIPIS